MSRTRSLTLAALLMASGIAFSIIAHALGIGGQVILPLHFPALLAGFLLGSGWGFGVGAVLPWLAAMTTGMPPLIPSALMMTPELAVYGFTTGVLRRPLGLIPSLLAALILGRVAWGLTAWILMPIIGLNISPMTAIFSSILLGLPGIIGQIVLIPVLVKRIEAVRR